MQHMETVELNVVTAAVLAEIAFDAAGDATNFSSKRYRETLEKMRRTGEFPQTWRPGSVDRTQPRQGAQYEPRQR
jgi:hypothetical protein